MEGDWGKCPFQQGPGVRRRNDVHLAPSKNSICVRERKEEAEKARKEVQYPRRSVCLHPPGSVVVRCQGLNCGSVRGGEPPRLQGVVPREVCSDRCSGPSSSYTRGGACVGTRWAAARTSRREGGSGRRRRRRRRRRGAGGVLSGGRRIRRCRNAAILIRGSTHVGPHR